MNGRALLAEALDVARACIVAVPPVVVIAVRQHADAWLFVGLAASTVLAWAQRASVRRRLGTVASVLASFRDGDFSTRMRARAGDLPLREVAAELSALGDSLRDHRLGAMEAWTLLRKVMAEVDVVVLAFDGAGRVRLANDAAAAILGKSAPSLVGTNARDLHLEALLSGAAPRIVKDGFVGGPWELRRGTFRMSGEAHVLVVLSDVARALRESERDAWRRLIRVMGHEINNSLTPIRSMSESLLAELASPRPSFHADLGEGLGVIARRAEALGRFMASYAKLARLPPPQIARTAVGPLVAKVAHLEQRVRVEVNAGDDALAIAADADQIEQVLINLVKNAADAVSENGGGVRVSWREVTPFVEIAIEDEGPGVGDTANLFVPFFTTKPTGSGIGLVLSREIVEAHDGKLTLASRVGGGAVARVCIPRA